VDRVEIERTEEDQGRDPDICKSVEVTAVDAERGERVEHVMERGEDAAQSSRGPARS
jgi:hypothetical protein